MIFVIKIIFIQSLDYMHLLSRLKHLSNSSISFSALCETCFYSDTATTSKITKIINKGIRSSVEIL